MTNGGPLDRLYDIVMIFLILVGRYWIAAVFVVLFIGMFLYVTRKRPGRRYPKKPVTQGEVTRDSWWFSG